MQVFAATRALAQHFGKHPCVSEDRPGFVLNRMLLPLINEAFFLLMEARSLQSISSGAEAAQRYIRDLLIFVETTTHCSFPASSSLWNRDEAIIGTSR